MTVISTFFHACYEAGCGFVRDKVMVTLAVAGLTMPMWHAVLKSASENAALLAPIVLLGVGLLKLWNEWPSKSERERAGWLLRLAPSLTAFKRAAWIAAAVLSVGLIFLFVSKGSASALPATAPAVVAGKKRKPNDDAGDEGDASAPDPDSIAAPPWFSDALIDARNELCERLPNGRANPEVRAMFAAVDGFDVATVDPRKVPWCAVYVNHRLQKHGCAGTRSAMARSPIRSRNFTRLDEPRIGCVVVMWRGSSDDGETGHVGFYAGAAGNYVNVLGGNQGDMVKIARFHKSRVLGYYWPRGKWQSKTNQGAAVASGATAAGTGAIAYGELADNARDVLEKVQEPLAQSGHPKAMKIAMLIGLALLVLGVAGALFAMYRRNKDHDAGL